MIQTKTDQTVKTISAAAISISFHKTIYFKIYTWSLLGCLFIDRHSFFLNYGKAWKILSQSRFNPLFQVSVISFFLWKDFVYVYVTKKIVTFYWLRWFSTVEVFFVVKENRTRWRNIIKVVHDFKIWQFQIKCFRNLKGCTASN